MIGRATCCGRMHASKAERCKVQSFDECFNDVDRVVFLNPVLEALGQEPNLRTVSAFDETTHPALPLHRRKSVTDSPVFTQPGSVPDRGSPSRGSGAARRRLSSRSSAS